MRVRLQQFRPVFYALAALAVLVGMLVACGDDDATDDAARTTQQAPATDEVPATVEKPSTTTTSEPAGDERDAALVEVATTYCEGFGRLEEPGAVDELIGMMADDVVLTDTVLGASLTGTEMVRGYLTSEVFADIDTALCGAGIQRGNWVAGSYSLGGSEAGIGAVGITVMHFTDGKVDQHISYYTPDQELVAPATEPVEESVAIDYCHAWDDGADADAVVSFLAPDAEFHFGGVVIEGADAIGEYVATTFDSDQNECGTVVVEHGAWVAGANTFTNTETGAVFEGVNVIRLDENEKITHHFGHLEVPVETTVAG